MRRLKKGTKLVVASHNKGKVWEINQLIAPYGLAAVSAGELGLKEPEETEDTFEGNARLKAIAAATASGLPALADDSGLEVAALGGAPGVYSANWAGPKKDFSLAMQRVHGALEDVGAWTDAPPRANFISVLCLAWPDGAASFYEGKVFGHLVWPPRGGNGFGFDPMFVPDGDSRTFGEMEPAGKYAISHRTRAFEKFRREALEHGAEVEIPPAANGKSGRDLEGLHAAAANLSTREEMLRFVANLRKDHAAHGASWASQDLAHYLASVEHWLATHDVEAEPKWRLIAKALLAGGEKR